MFGGGTARKASGLYSTGARRKMEDVLLEIWKKNVQSETPWACPIHGYNIDCCGDGCDTEIPQEQ
jgi:hypothetical protein